MKHSGNERGKSELTIPDGNTGGQISARAPVDLVIVPLANDFDLVDAFLSEAEPPKIERMDVDRDPPVAETLAQQSAIAGPSQPSTPPDVRAATLSVADLIENNVRLEWYEAVAIAQRLCRCMAREAAVSVQQRSLEPHNVEITNRGEVRVLPGGPGSDPLVKQVGRILRALLQDVIAPAELRLLASQASFEVPVYASVDDLSLALRRYERPGEPDAVRMVFKRGLDAKFSARPSLQHLGQTRLDPSIRPQAGTETSSVPHQLWSYKGLRLVALPAVMVVSIGLTFLLMFIPRSHPPDREEIILNSEPPSTRAREHDDASPARRETAPPPSAAPAAAPQRIAARGRAVSVRPHDVEAESSVFERRPVGETTLVTAPPAPAKLTPEMIPGESPEVFSALARRDYENARAAFDRGDFDRAIAEGRRVWTMVNDREIALAAADLSAAVKELLARAFSAKLLEEEKIYTSADPGVVAPTALGRRLPAARPPGVPLQLVGRLEMLIGLGGEVESVKLHTPLNRYHERMIVSAAKAWRYRPALKNGKPVRFTLVISINLPESS